MTRILPALALAVLPMAAAAEIETAEAEGSVAEVMNRLEIAVAEAGATIFAKVDHAGGADAVGMAMNDAQLLIFGNPRLGTPIMQADPRAGLVLPMKMLVYADDDGRTHIVWPEVESMFDEFDVDGDLEAIDKIEEVVNNFVQSATQ
ncbi:DUF302 domain-containing protein [Palleronia sediminis]|uniref:DUF302 domain-containing protein n=1 Tax=Palleronia sediminis TaxID=2547833 RepID=A0A4R6AJ72_9RHOB|nr:DUF302 domain-containing protein [Palleronia sediminis]TDL84271.1 DUF302 domain-containing protein [Palleronia sediminis]